MNKKQLYESIMASVAKEVKKALNEAGPEKFNNSEAYRFLKLYVVKAIIMTMGSAAKVNDSTDSVKMKIKIGRSLKDVNVTMCYKGSNEVGISQSKMMNMKNMAFISDDKIYIVNGDFLRENWNNKSVCRTDTTYTDRIGERSVMTKFKLEFLKENASDIISMTNDAIAMYETAYNEMSIK